MSDELDSTRTILKNQTYLPEWLEPDKLVTTFTNMVPGDLGHNITDPTKASAARATLVSIPTYDGSGVVVHPSVYFNPDGWSGHKYWMAFTPYPSSQNQLENASVVCSDDGQTWAVPDGLTNPIGPAVPGGVGYNSDPNIFVDKQGLMHLFWREYIYNVAERHVYKTSTDGINWSEKVLIREDLPTTRRIMSPAYMQLPDNSWVMYGVDILPSPARKVVRSAAPTLAGPWTIPTVCTITGNAAVPWHLDIHRHGGEWQALVQSSVGDGSGGDLWAMVSQDGINFTAGPALIPRGSPGVDWDASYYKSTFVPAIRYGLAGWDAWVGGATFPASGQIVGRTFITFDNTPALVAAAIAALPAPASNRTVDILAAKNGISPWVASDTFSRADGALTTAESGQTWAASAGTFTITNKTLVPSAATNTRVTLAVGASNITSTVQIAGASNAQHWLIFRYVDAANYYRYGIASDGRLSFQRITAGATAAETTVQMTAPASGFEITAKAVGSTITLYLDGVQKNVITDSTHSGTSYGLQASTTNAGFKYFRVATA